MNSAEMNQPVAEDAAAFSSGPEGDVRVVVPDGFTVSSLDAAVAAGMVEGSLPRILKHYAAIEAAFGAERAAYIHGLQRLANETQDAHLQVRLSDAAGSLGALHADVLHEHALLLSDAEGLVHRKLLELNVVAPCRPTRGFRTTAASTLRLVKLFRERWAQISERTATKLPDLERAEAKALQMRQRLNEREQGSHRLEAVARRARALALLVRQYGEVRRMIGFVRFWQGDVDAIAPSLWSGRRTKKRAVRASKDGPDEPNSEEPLASPKVSSGEGGGSSKAQRQVAAPKRSEELSPLGAQSPSASQRNHSRLGRCRSPSRGRRAACRPRHASAG